MTTVLIDYEEEVCADVELAAVFLDNEVRDWYQKIDLDRLNMASASRCIAGQLKRDWVELSSTTPPSSSQGERKTYAFAVGHNFWQEEIEKRRRADVG